MQLRKYAEAHRSEPYWAQVGRLLNTFYGSRKGGSPPDYIDVEVEYDLSKKKRSLYDLGVGRRIGSAGSLERFPVDVRSTLCHGLLTDIDICNCHPSLLVLIAKRDYSIDLPTFQYYVDHRGAFLEYLDEYFNVEVVDAKAAILSVAYGGALVKDSPDVLLAMKSEAEMVIRRMLRDEKYKPVATAIRALKEGNFNGRFLSYVLQTEERKCLDALHAFFTERGFVPDVLAYDGLMIRVDDHLTADVLAEAEEAVKEATGYAIKLKEKPLEPMDLSGLDEMTEAELGEYVDGVSLADYNAAKLDFEKNHFLHLGFNMVAELRPDGSVHYTKIDDGAIRFVDWDFVPDKRFPGKTVSFFKLWVKDKTRRSHSAAVLAPTGEEGELILPFIPAYTRVEPDETAAECIALFDQLMTAASNNKPEVKEYLMNWFADMVQNPFERSGVSVIATGAQGIGKDSIALLFGKYILGKLYYAQYPDQKQMMADHDVGRVNKIFAHVEEVKASVFKMEASKFKADITSEAMNVNPKYGTPTAVPRYERYYLTTNQACPVEVNDGERRFVILDYAPTYLPGNPFWKRWHTLVKTPQGGAAIGRMLAARDLSGWDPRTLPKNERLETLISLEAPSWVRFIKEAWDGHPVAATTLFRMYQDFCGENDLPPLANAISFGKKLGTLMLSMPSLKTYKKGCNYWCIEGAAEGAGAGAGAL